MMGFSHRAIMVVAVVLGLTVPAGVAAAANTGTGTVGRATAGINWPAYLMGPAHRSTNAAATAITPVNAPNLTQVWRWKPAKATMTGQPGPSLFASPTVFDGRVYIGANTGVFYALDEQTGHVLWHQFLGFVTGKTCGARGIISTATVARDPVTGAQTVYVAGADGYLYALDAGTGAIDWRSVVGLPSSTVNDYYNWSSPAVVNGHVYVGVSSQCDNPLVMGGLKEYNQATGALLAFYETNPGGSKAASIWSSPAAVLSGKSVFVTTGNGPAGDSMSVVRLDGTTLAKLGSWQLPKSDQIKDSDFGGSPTLFSASLGTHVTPMIGACNKNGWYYALRRYNLTAGPVWKFQVGAPAAAGSGQCDAASVWNGTNLFVAGPQAVVGGTTYNGSVSMLDPATGTPVWQRGLPGAVVGTPTLDGADVLAVPTYSSSGLFLLDAATGAILANIVSGPEFGQPVFADDIMLVPTLNQGLLMFR